MAIPLLEALDIQGKEITADALLTQRKLAEYIVKRQAHYHSTVKENQPTLLEDIRFYFEKSCFENRREPDYIESGPPEHGRIETRRIWTTTELNGYLDFPHVGQAFAIERHSIEKKTGRESREIAYGLTSRTPEQANPQRVLATNRGHWSIENCCHWPLDWNYDEDRCRIRTGHGPENITRLRRFAIGLHKSKKPTADIAQQMRRLNRNNRLVLHYLGMTQTPIPYPSRN
jgi:predicted transposase YbfD/YdcC